MAPVSDIANQAAEAALRGDVGALMRLMSDEIVVHVPGSSALAGDHQGKAGVIGGFMGRMREMSDETISWESSSGHSDEDLVVIVYNASARRGGRGFKWRHVVVYRIGGGHIQETWHLPVDLPGFDAFWS